MPHLAHGLRCLTLIGALLGALAACATVGTRRPPNAADSLFALTQLNEIVVGHTQYVLQSDVRQRLALGLRLERLPSNYAMGRREEARYARSVQRELEEIRYDALSQDDYLTLHAMHWELENEAESPIYRALDYTAVIPGASPLRAIARALSQHPIEDVQDVERYLYLLDILALYLAETRQVLAEQAAAGIAIPQPPLDSVIAFLRQFRQPAAESPFRLAADGLTRIDSLSRPTVVAALTQRIESDINVQIDSLVAYLSGAYRASLRDSSDAMLGLSQYPGGREYYLYLLRRSTTLEVAPTDLYTYGVREVERITAALTALREKLDYKGSDSAFRAMLREDARFIVATPTDFERRVVEALGRIRDSMRVRLGITVADSVTLIASSSQMLDGARPLTLREPDAIEPRFRLEYAADRVTHVPAYVIPALVARELVPGRYTLLSTTQQNESLPTIRQLMRFEGFVDGWSEYARGLVGELGLYGEAHDAYGALILELESAARMVTDLGLHYFGWTHAQAVRYLRAHSVDASTAGSAVLRIAVAEPARAVAAKVGSREFAGQRAWVRRQLGGGTQFDDGALQREVLRVGVLPLPILSQHLAWYVWKLRTRG